MTNFFNNRSGFGNVKSYSYYTSTDKSLTVIGLSSWTRNSLPNFGKTGGSDDPDIAEFFGGSLSNIRTGLLGDSSTLFIYRFDPTFKDYVYSTSAAAGENNLWWSPSGNNGSGGSAFSSLSNFQTQFDLYQKGWIKEDATNVSEQLNVFNVKYVWSKINHSLSGCINFMYSDYTILGNSASGEVVSIFFQGKGDGSNRGIALQPPIIAGVGSTATGKEYSYNISETLGIGSISPPDVGGVKNPNNTVAGELNLHFNRGTGKWESGTTQVICRILDDIPGVPWPEIPSTFDEIGNKDLMIPFNSGYGMVMSTEKANPHLCAPVSYGCENSPKEKIVVVNRSSRAFVKNEVALASQINGDWVPIPLANGVSVTKKLTIEWSQIQKYIVNAKGFFRNDDDTRFIDHNDYKKWLRTKFYDNFPKSAIASGNSHLDKNALRTLNLAFSDEAADTIEYELNSNGQILLSDLEANIDLSLKDIKPSKQYYQFYDADMIPKNLGGNNTGPARLRSTVIKRTEPSDPGFGLTSQDVPMSWGMYFPDGYVTASVTRTKGKTNGTPKNPNYKIYGGGSLSFSTYTSLVAANTFNLKDPYFYHMPAQFALNGARNQTINISNFVAATSGSAFCNDLVAYMSNPIKGDWLIDGNSGNIYALTPFNPSLVQFTPLSLELALSSTFIKDEGKGKQIARNGGYSTLRDQLIAAGANLETEGTDGFFGGAWSRLGFKKINIDFDPVIRGFIGFAEFLENDRRTQFGPPARGDQPDGGPDMLPNAQTSKERSNVMGIIAAKATITLSNGGAVELKTSNNIGVPSQAKLTGGGGNIGVFSPIPSFLTFFDSGGTTKTLRIIKWGGSLGDEQIKEMGTTSLWCAVYDHAPNVLYDGRYLCPIQMNPSGESVDFKDIALSAGTVINSGTVVSGVNTTIRRSALLTNGGFSYIKKAIGILDASSVTVVSGGRGYSIGDEVIFNLNGDKPAKFIVSSVNGTSIAGVSPKIGVADKPDEIEGLPCYGSTTINPFSRGPIEGSVKWSVDTETDRSTAIIKANSGKVIETLSTDRVNFYGLKKITPNDNNGEGNANGFVTGNKTTVFKLPNNTKSVVPGKYDFFFFFVSDILNYPEGPNFLLNQSLARYVNLEITSV